MKIVIIGYGKMGKAIERMAMQRGHTIIACIDTFDSPERKAIPDADVAIEFSQPDSVIHNLEACFDAQVPVVCGTTGWLEHKSAIEKSCVEHGGTLFYASNFSLGVNILFKVNAYLAKIMDSYPAYDVRIDEVHHTQKKDAPSGTAITLAEGILSNIQSKHRWIHKGNATAEDLVINSFRVDPTPGTHTVRYTSPIEDIEIKHTAHSRDGFVLGAILVAEWIQGKKGVLGMADFLKL
ncbi:MAG TPA: 4-hydroxy-tetrahydrodipicolinate reductase [Cyclobacteriaceae bacterium]